MDRKGRKAFAKIAKKAWIEIRTLPAGGRRRISGGAGVVFSYGKDLRSGNNVFYVTTLR